MNRYALPMNPFFVYGTLIPGQPNDHLWQDGIESVETAVFDGGKLYDMGYYPMLVEEKGGSVQGKLITVIPTLYRQILDRLDNLEGYSQDQPTESSFTRVERNVLLRNGKAITAWLYAGHLQYAVGKQEIPGGDWVSFAADLRGEMDNWWQSVDTVYGLLNGQDES